MTAYQPQEDTYLIADLPGERVRAMIRRVVTADAVIVELTSIPLAKSHTYTRGDYVALRRKDTSLGEIWEAVREQKISIEKVASEVRPTPKAKKKKKTKKAKK